jgi:hypothetical protein
MWSGHRTMAMLLRYHIIDLEDLRRAGKKASDYRGPTQNVVKWYLERTVPEPSRTMQIQARSASRGRGGRVLSLRNGESGRRESNPRPLDAMRCMGGHDRPRPCASRQEARGLHSCPAVRRARSRTV